MSSATPDGNALIAREAIVTTQADPSPSRNRTLRANADGSEERIEYPSTNCMTMHLDSAGLTGTGCDGGDVGR
jgi:hypothetical protein